MVKSEILSNRPSKWVILQYRFIRYIKVGRFLHLMTLTSFAIFFASFKNVDFSSDQAIFNQLHWIFFSLFGITVFFIAQMDAYGRFQNYKLLKDKFHEYGFNLKLVTPFMTSKCQRDAVLIAANDFGFRSEVKAYFYYTGYRWFHILPDICLKHPFVVLKINFWNKILFTKYYQLQNYYW